MLLAEAVTFDPGLVVALFIVFLLVCATAVAVVVTGICSGYRAGRDPGRTRAVNAWRTCLTVDAAAFVIAVVAGAPVEVIVSVAVVTALTWLARRVGAGSTDGPT